MEIKGKILDSTNQPLYLDQRGSCGRGEDPGQVCG